MGRQIRVVGAVITNQGCVLAAQRGMAGSLAGLWEFPGGKIEHGETPEEALEREIREELGCSITVGREVTTTVHDYDFGQVTLTTFYCKLAEGSPESTEHSDLRWLAPHEFTSVEWAPADMPAVALIGEELG